jgi:hypothetical protein
MTTEERRAETASKFNVLTGIERNGAEMVEHTPGPWSFDQDWHRIPTIFAAEGRTMVATIEKGTCGRDARPGADREANARLIAAAPDMLEALLEVRNLVREASATGFNCHDGDWAERLFYNQAKVSEAIRKAEGRALIAEQRGES